MGLLSRIMKKKTPVPSKDDDDDDGVACQPGANNKKKRTKKRFRPSWLPKIRKKKEQPQFSPSESAQLRDDIRSVNRTCHHISITADRAFVTIGRMGR